jgi:hypothetical protein
MRNLTTEMTHAVAAPLSDTTMNMLQRTIVSGVRSDPSFWSRASTISANLSYFSFGQPTELAESPRFSHHKVWHITCSINNLDRVRCNRHNWGRREISS